jgi:ferrous iron transport protein A
MGWMLFALFIAFASWQVFKGLKKTLQGEGCSNCSGCGGACRHQGPSLSAEEVLPPLKEERGTTIKEEMNVTLDEIRPGGRATIRKNGATGAVKQRMMDMGFHRGTVVEVVRNAPLVDPVEFLMDGQHVSLRHSEARLIEVDR